MQGAEIEGYFEGLRQGKILGTRCGACGHAMVPMRPACPACGSDRLTGFEARGEGSLQAFTVIHVAPPRFADQAPYVVGLVRLAEGPSLMARIRGVEATKPENIRYGMAMKAEFATDNERPSVLFRAVENPG
jgi:uncharacterized OB-fold protein